MDYLLLPSSPHQEFRNRQPQWSRLNNSKKKKYVKKPIKVNQSKFIRRKHSSLTNRSKEENKG